MALGLVVVMLGGADAGSAFDSANTIDDLAIHNGRFRRKCRRRLDDRAVFLGPVEAATGEGASLPVLYDQLGTIAIAGRWVIDQGLPSQPALASGAA